MATTHLNGVTIKRAYFNGVDLNKIYLNGALVFSKVLVINISNHYTNKNGEVWTSLLIAAYRKYGETEIIFKIAKGVEIPQMTIVSTPSDVKKITIENYGTISARKESGSAIYARSTFYLNNHGTIRGGGGRGGTGGKGGTGHAGANTTKTTHHTKATTETKPSSWPAYVYAIGMGSTCDIAAWAGKHVTKCTGRDIYISGYGHITPGKFRSHNGPYDRYDAVRHYTRKWDTHATIKGGAGGAGGAGGRGGLGNYFLHTDRKSGKAGGHTGYGGHKVSGGHTGYRGGKGGTGADGGTWGHTGYKGSTGSRGEGSGSSGAGGSNGGAAGHSIDGKRYMHVVSTGTLIGTQIN